MDGSDDILRAIERVYAAVADPDQWRAAVEAVAGLAAADHVILTAVGAAVAPLVATARVDERDLVVAQEAAARQTEGMFERLPQGVLVRRSALLSDREYLMTDHYNEIVRPLNGFHGLGAVRLAPEGGYVLAICRHQNREDFDGPVEAALQPVLPHMETALALRGRLLAADQRAAGIGAAFEQLGTAAVLVDGTGEPVLVNAAAMRLLAEGDGLTIDRNGLKGMSGPVTHALRSAIAVAAGTAIPEIVGGVAEQRLRLPRPSGRPPLLLSLLPVWRCAWGLPGVRAPRIAIHIQVTDAPPAIDRTALADVYRLTRREAEVASLLAGGTDPVGVALELGIGLGTVRVHLKRIFAKTGTRGQAALVALVRGFTVPER